MDKTRVMIVEDERLVLQDLERTLVSFDYEIAATASTGEEAVKAALTCSPDIILMDIMLGNGIDGIDVAAQINKHIDVPIIFCTASSDMQTLRRAKKSAPYGYINKPFDDQSIFSSIEMAIGKFSAEKKLKDSQRHLKAMLNGIGDGIITFDINGIITFINPAAADLLGYSSEETIGRHKSEIIPFTIDPSDKTNVTMSINPNTYKFVMNVKELEIPRKGKEPVLASITNSAILGENDDIIGMVLSIRDITEHKKMQNTIENAAKEWRLTFDAMNDPVCLVDAGGKIKRCNNALTHLLNLSFFDIVSHAPDEIIIFSGSSAGDGYNIKDFYTSKTHMSGEFILSGRWMQVTSDPRLGADGSLEGSVIVLKDIHARKIAEEELAHHRKYLEEIVETRTSELRQTNTQLEKEIVIRQNAEKMLIASKERADAANTAKSEFLSNMSHELRTPLNSVIGFAKLIKMGVEPSDAAEYVNNILNSGEHLLKLINEILDLSKIEAGKITLDQDAVDINSVISSCLVLIKAQSDAKMITLQYQPPSELFHVRGDYKRLRQVLLNLLSNAVKFTPERGQVRVLLSEKNNSCVIQVIDTGVGIKEDHYDFIFEKFSQVDSSLSRSTSGTGLGLAITKSIVEAHGGSIDVTSVVGKGSTFTVHFPLLKESAKEASQQTEQPKSPYPQWLKKKMVLIVEDDLRDRELLNSFFALNGQQHQSTEDGTEALEIFANGGIDIILMDIGLSNINGTTAMKAMKAGRPVPVIAVTSDAMEGAEKRFLNEGFDAYISKPVDFYHLIEIMRNVLSQPL